MADEKAINSDILTPEEVANYLKVSERTVFAWVQSGEIPATKIGSVWRFLKADVEQWVKEKFSINKQSAGPLKIRPEMAISPDRIVFLDTCSKKEALLKLASNICTAPQIKNPDEFADKILKKEESVSTAIGMGIAIPHIKLFSITDLVVSIGISQTGISDFMALDNEPVRLIIMIAAAYNQHTNYLQTLSFFSSKLKDRTLQEAILSADNPGEIYKLFMA